MRAGSIRTVWIRDNHMPIDDAINQFLEENPELDIVDIKYARCIEGQRMLFHESALVIYNVQESGEEVSE